MRDFVGIGSVHIEEDVRFGAGECCADLPGAGETLRMVSVAAPSRVRLFNLD